MIKNHPWVGGNKRTATFLADSFLNRNGLFISAPKSEFVELVLAIEADRWQTAEIEAWLRQHTQPLP
jgi:prophage maintenance system killer protein